MKDYRDMECFKSSWADWLQEIRQAQLDALEDAARAVEWIEGPLTAEVAAAVIRRLKERV